MKRYISGMCAVLTVSLFIFSVLGQLKPELDFTDDFTFDTSDAVSEINGEVLEYLENSLCDSIRQEAYEAGITAEDVRVIINAENVSAVRVREIHFYDTYTQNEREKLTELCIQLFEREVKVIFENG